ncbi:MAG TPA: mannose-6-phosphate isomerase, class I, partial [Streptosporangiaceae bacterium]|nr:mannose-6-phosphate isomerase, class I [Streptosporangiaceae bacterium]
MDLLSAKVKPYPWGTRDAIADLQGRPVPAPGPEAELWMGAHPGAPSGVGWTTLDEVIAAAPERALGAECAARFGDRLPFLLKVLSAAQALSIQVHPSRAQALQGWAAEDARGLPPGDPGRNYVDDWPKPELLYALTPFEVVAGLRDPDDAATLLRALAVDALEPLAAGLAAAAGPEVMATALASVLRWPPAERAGLLAAVVAACARLAASGGPYAAACAAAVRVAADHPDDLGVVALLLMRHGILQPGQAMFMPAGGLHSYLRGTGIELLANSDNVVRAGLTGKHVDVPELLKLVDPAVPVPVLAPRVLPDGIAWFDTPAPEFRLHIVDLSPPPASSGPAGFSCPARSSGPAGSSGPAASSGPASSGPAGSSGQARSPGPAGAFSASRAGAVPAPSLVLPGTGPRIVLCLDGACTLRAASAATLDLSRGDSCFIPFADGSVAATGHARLILATTA